MKSNEVAAPIPARGVIARKVSELFTVTLEHKGGEWFEIAVTGNLSKQGTAQYRNGEIKALNHFDSKCIMLGAK